MTDTSESSVSIAPSSSNVHHRAQRDYSPDSTTSCTTTNLSIPFSSASTVSMSPQNTLEIFCKQMLKNRVFLGHYQEKRFVQSIKKYRDLIVLNKSEKDVIDDLEEVENRIRRHYFPCGQTIWFGYTNANDIGVPHGSCIWTDLSSSSTGSSLPMASNESTIPFGEYWFQIKTVRFRDNEIFVKLKMLRPKQNSDLMSSRRISVSNNLRMVNIVDSTTTTSSSHRQRTPLAAETETNDAGRRNNAGGGGDGGRGDGSSGRTSEEFITDFQQLFAMWQQSIHDFILWLLSQQLTAANLIHFFKLIGVILIATLTGSLYLIKYLGFFTLRFMEESSRLIHVLMPLLIQCVDLLGKLFGGFYILLAMIWRDSVGGGGRRRNSQPQVYRRVMPQPGAAGGRGGGAQPNQQQAYGIFSHRMGEERRAQYSNTYNR